MENYPYPGRRPVQRGVDLQRDGGDVIMPRYEVVAHIYVEAVDPAEARDIAVAALEYAQDTPNDDGAIVDCFVDIETYCMEP